MATKPKFKVHDRVILNINTDSGEWPQGVITKIDHYSSTQPNLYYIMLDYPINTKGTANTLFCSIHRIEDKVLVICTDIVMYPSGAAAPILFGD